MIIEIREEARGDLHIGYRFYEEQAVGLGRYFLECILADIDALGFDTPSAKTPGCHPVRRGRGLDTPSEKKPRGGGCGS